MGALAIAAGALYTGGPRPYGYSGFGELAVLVFFGFVATMGSAYVQLEHLTWLATVASVPVGLLACAILLANNVRDVETDRASGKRTLAVRMGEQWGRRAYVACIAVTFLTIAGLGVTRPPVLVGLLALPLAWAPVQAVRRATDARTLIGALVGTARLQIVTSVLLAAGLWVS